MTHSLLDHCCVVCRYLKTVLVETSKLIRYDVADLLHHYLQGKAMKGQALNLFMDVIGGMKRIDKANFDTVYREVVFDHDPKKFDNWQQGRYCWEHRNDETFQEAACYPRDADAAASGEAYKWKRGQAS